MLLKKCKDCNNDFPLRKITVFNQNRKKSGSYETYFCDYCNKNLNIPKLERIKVQKVIDINSHEWFESNFQQYTAGLKFEKEKFKQFMGFASVAIDDYLAARIMLLNNELFTGSALACSAVEKYLKAFMLGVFQIDKDINHFPLKIYNQIKTKEPYFPSFNCWFFDYLSTAYNFRYREDLQRNHFFQRA
jgi:hypothetical protein